MPPVTIAYGFVGQPPPRVSVTLSVVLPVYNEQAVLEQTYRRVKDVCEAAGLPGGYEIILVNDGSTDGTWPLMQRLAGEDAATVLVNLSRNHGHQLALAAGLHVAAGERILMLDADLQDPPELLPEMMKVMDNGADVVYAQRRRRDGDPAAKRLAAAVFYRLLRRLSDTPIPLDAGDFRLISRRVLEVLLQMPERARFIRGMVTWAGFTQVPLAYDRDRRMGGRTKYSLRKLVKLALDGIACSSLRPLAFASVAGGLAAFFGLALLAYSLYSWMFVGQTPQGWTSLIITVTLLSSIQLFVLGIIGEYLGRLYDESRGRPLFVVERVMRHPRHPLAQKAPPVIEVAHRPLEYKEVANETKDTARSEPARPGPDGGGDQL